MMSFLLLILRCLLGLPLDPPDRLLPIMVRRDGRMVTGTWTGSNRSGSEFRLGLPQRSWIRLATWFQRFTSWALRFREKPDASDASLDDPSPDQDCAADQRTNL